MERHFGEMLKDRHIIQKIDMDNGSFPYAKDIARVLAKTKLSNIHRGIIDLILCETFGWYDNSSGKKEKFKKRRIWAKITYSGFQEWGGYPYPKIAKALTELIRWKVISRKGKPRHYEYSFNVNVSEWDNRVFKPQFQHWGHDYLTEESEEIKALKKLILQRDNHECQLCGSSEGELIIHHIDYNKDNWTETNLISFCRQCHAETNINKQYWKDLLTKKVQNKYSKLSKKVINEKDNYPKREQIVTQKGNYMLPEKVITSSEKRDAESGSFPLNNNINNNKISIYARNDKNPSELPSKRIKFSFETQKWEGIEEEDIKRLKESYPACDIQTELARMREWILANPQKRKKNWYRFIVNWLTRTQERGGTAGVQQKNEKKEDRLKRLQQKEERKKLLMQRISKDKVKELYHSILSGKVI